MRISLCVLLLAPALNLVEGLAQAEVAVRAASDIESGIYEPGKTATWTISGPAGAKAAYVVRLGGLKELAKGEVQLAGGKASVSATRSEPGTLLLEVRTKSAAGKDVVAYGAAAFAPEKIAPSMPPPDDFDAFWKAKLAELRALPANAVLEKVDVGDASVEYWKITLDHVGGRKIRGQLAKPAGKGSGLAAILQVQWAGVYALNRDWVLGSARGGWLAMNLQAHDLPIDEKAEFYAEKSKKELSDYPGIGSDDRERSYFLPMFLSCVRAVDYLTERPEWNRKHVVVHGGSQGGYQAIVTAGLHPAVTAFAANVPAGCDHTGKEAGRAPGWPNWTGRTWQGKDAKKLLETGRYFDAMNFASRTKAAALVGVGLVDTVCPAEGVLATCNLLQGPKQIVIMPRSGHGGEGPGHQAYYAVFGRFLDDARR